MVHRRRRKRTRAGLPRADATADRASRSPVSAQTIAMPLSLASHQINPLRAPHTPQLRHPAAVGIRSRRWGAWAAPRRPSCATGTVGSPSRRSHRPLWRTGAHHGYGALPVDLGRNNCFRRLGCRRDDHCGLALDAHGTTCRHSRITQPLWVGSGSQGAAFLKAIFQTSIGHQETFCLSGKSLGRCPPSSGR